MSDQEYLDGVALIYKGSSEAAFSSANQVKAEPKEGDSCRNIGIEPCG
nr:hypothetical protein [Pseudomonas plecoglossicida]